MELKYCPGCEKHKDINDFSKSIRRKDGRQPYCKLCKKQHDASYYNRNREKQYNRVYNNKRILREAINAIKSENGCRYCPENDPACLDFHHIGDKVESIADMVTNVSKKRLFEEIKKCEVVCANCHRKLHTGRKMSPRC